MLHAAMVNICHESKQTCLGAGCFYSQRTALVFVCKVEGGLEFLRLNNRESMAE